MGYGGYNVGTLNAITYANITHAGIPAYTGDVYPSKWITYTIAFLSFYNYFVSDVVFHGKSPLLLFEVVASNNFICVVVD